MQVEMLEAKTELSELVDAAERGEEVVIARNGVPIAEIVVVSRKELPLGFLKGKIGPIDDSVFRAMNEEETERFLNGKD